MIYLFCNEAYGQPFIESAARASSELELPLTMVFSTRGIDSPPPASLVGSLRRNHVRRRRSKAMQNRYGLPALFAADVNSEEFRGELEVDSHGIITGFNQIFRRATIESLASFVNFHPSLLPYYRGPTPSAWCLRNGESHSGYTMHRVTRRIDDGEILSQESVSTEGLTTAEELDRRIATAGAVTLRRWLEHLNSQVPFETVRLDAAAIYRERPDYLSFDRGA